MTSAAAHGYGALGTAVQDSEHRASSGASSPALHHGQGHQTSGQHVGPETLLLVCAPRFYGEAIPGNVLCERVASYLHMYNLYWSVRWVAPGRQWCAQNHWPEVVGQGAV